MKELESFVIERPELKTRLRSGVETTVTLLAWLVWVYLLIPLVTLLMWVVGLRLIIIEQVMLSGISGIASVFIYYLAAGLGIWCILGVWHAYNRRRFQGHDRRREALPVTPEEIQRQFGLSADVLEEVGCARNVFVRFPEGNPEFRVRET